MDHATKNVVVCDDATYIEDFDALWIHLPTAAKYPAKQHARSVAKHLGVNEGLIYLLGQQQQDLEDSDMPVPFRQRRYFYYLTGVEFENCIVTYDIASDFLQLYIPPVNAKQVIWLGPTPSIEESKEKYNVDAVCLTNNVGHYLEEWLRKNERPTIYLLHKFQAPYIRISGSADINFTALKLAMDSARVIKSDFEIGLIRCANDISSRAHRCVLEELLWMVNEAAIEATFLASCVLEGAKKQAYNIIAASGENASTLHYDANNQPLKGRQLVCLDAGCEWNCYASDITRTFPISGIYTKEAKEIYSIVQKMQETCISLIKPGKMFREIHLTAMRIAVEGLMGLGILCNGTFEEVLPTGVAFFPHGLGHHLGLETHDVSGSQRLLADIDIIHDLRAQNTAFYYRYIGTYFQKSGKLYDGDQKLAPNMVVTVEPGLYFSRYALEKVYLEDPKHAKYINKGVLEKYYPVGGVRIEDDILVTSTGYENLTTAPKGEEACEIIKRGSSGKCGRGLPRTLK